MKNFNVAAYYFPNYHPDPRNALRHGEGWTEWELVKKARPRFYAHRQPKQPLWGYTDESDPLQMAQKIDAAASHGIDAFIFDWYYYDDGPFLQRGVEQGFMKAPNADQIKFGLMWANHDWLDIHPAELGKIPELVYPGTVSPKTFDYITDLLIEQYFSHPSYWTIDGRPYFSIYELHTLIKSFGTVAETANALKEFRNKVAKADLPGLHLNAVSWGIQLLPGETAVSNPEALIQALGFDSVTSYVWIHDVPLTSFPETNYVDVLEQVQNVWKKNVNRFGVPYFPNVTMGWDASPRCSGDSPFENRGYPFMATMSNNTPEAFKQALLQAKHFLETHPQCRNTITLNCWNEWTEGSYLEPDQEHEMNYLEAIKAVFGTAE